VVAVVVGIGGSVKGLRIVSPAHILNEFFIYIS
jgi:hypothetical protein